MRARSTDDSSAPIRVLCVDDDRDFRDLVAIYLGERRDDISVETVADGEAVLERLTTGGIDCVVSDYRMPQMDGLTLLDEVRATHPDLPFILFTGRGGEDVASEAVSAGVTDYILKSSDPGQFDLLANRIRNVVERHRARTQYQAIFDTVSEAVLVIDPNRGTVVDANRRASDLWRYDDGDIIGRPVDALRVPERVAESRVKEQEAGRHDLSSPESSLGTVDTPNSEDQADRNAPGVPSESVLIQPDSTIAALAGGDYDGVKVSEWHCIRQDGTRFWAAISRKTAEIDGRQRTLVIARDVTRRKVHRQQLDSLLDLVRELLVVQTETEIANAVEESVVETLRFHDAGVYLIDTESAEFTRIGVESSGDTDPPSGGGNEETELLWDALDGEGLVVTQTESGETRESGSADSVSSPMASMTRGRDTTVADSSRFYIPIGEMGVLACTAGDETDHFDVELAALLATYAAGAFDRARRESLLREREETLRNQRDELLSLDHVNAVIRDINQALVSVSSREGIERVVCEKFAATDGYGLAWMGEFDSNEMVISPSASAGHAVGFLPNEIPIDPDGTDPISTTVTERSLTVIDRITPETVSRERYRLVRDRGFKSIAFIPIVHQNVLYRVLTIYAEKPDAFAERERAVLSELGETIGLALAASEWRSARISDTIVELELAVKHESALFELTTGGDTRLELHDMRETGEGLVRVVGQLFDGTFEAFETAVDAVPSLGNPIRLGEGAGGPRVAFTIHGGSLLDAITAGGISLRDGTIADGEATFRLTVPAGTDVRWIVDQFSSAFDSVELLGRRDQYRSETASRLADVFDGLTDRQQEVLRVAHYAGYFETPREATGNEVAELLGVTQPTFNEHLRNAERRLFNELLQS